MEKSEVIEMLKKENGIDPKPLEYLSELDMNVLQGHLGFSGVYHE